ncbi:MAG: Heparinase II/III family protein [Candidatus Tokpelaia sp. JSC189]|nr:MAG: Heparinase II/III family protein [Candidatus Tokpelaia sp. JSC189]
MASSENSLSDIWASSVIDRIGNIIRRLRMGPLFRWRFTGFRPNQILANPVDLHLADPNLAHEFYYGRFPLAGRVVQVGSISPFIIEPPTLEWEAALQDFSWLRHMTSSRTALANAHARSLMADWINTVGKRISGNGWRPDITARRIIAWLSHADTLFYGASPAFQEGFLKSLGIQVRYLRTAVNSMPWNETKLQARIALAFSALALPVSASVARNTRINLERELNRHILPDGGHISRNPAILLDLLIYLISLRHCYSESKETPPPVLITMVDRMLPALRFFQHRDGTLANFNGAGPTLAQWLDIVLDIDVTAGLPFSHAPHSGYQRLAFGKTTIIADTGRISHRKFSQKANAGCLSFEMSSGKRRFIVNCGIDPYGPSDFCFFGRLTAAHSTATVNDTSSCHFHRSDKPNSTIVSGPAEIEIKRIEEDNFHGFIATHDGYRRNFNLLHQRRITLSHTGDILAGSDSFFNGQYRGALPNHKNSEVTVRFHLHPEVKVNQNDSKTLQLEIPGEDIWLFSSDTDMNLEDSIYFSGLFGPTKTQQIMLSFRPLEQNTAKWIFRCLKSI